MSTKSILLVQNNLDDTDLALRALRTGRVPGEVVVTHDGVEALEYLFGMGAHAGRDLRAMPACLLLDLKLPKLDGLEVLRRVRADSRTRLIPIVILTSSCEPQDIRAAYRLGANSYICKPVNFALFADAVRQVGHYWLTFNEAPQVEGSL
jgi:two-component system, response regulator